jgi:hypothetical protein
MIDRVTKSDFHDRFQAMGRGEQFSYEAKNALFDWLEEYEDSTGEQVELDIIALCCEYSEMDDLGDYNSQYEPVECIEDIDELTIVIRIDGSDGFIIQQY